MFNVRLEKGSAETRMVISDAEKPEEPDNELDSQENEALHSRLLDYYSLEIERQAENRDQMNDDARFYDGKQWTDEELAELKNRGQAPLVYNVIATSVDWVTGSEKRGRTDFKILPRTKEDALPAERKSKYMKYLSDVNRTAFHRSRAFEDAVKVGIGWLETSIQEEDEGEEPLYDRYESWRNIIFDSSSTELDGSDMRYIFRSRIVDVDIAVALFPEREDVIKLSTGVGSMFITEQFGDDSMDAGEELTLSHIDHERTRVRLIEGQYRMPEKTEVVRGGLYNGQFYNKSDPRHVAAIEEGSATIIERVSMRVYNCVFTSAGFLFKELSPFQHNRFKFVPIWGLRDDETGLPYGLVRRMKDIQADVNKRASKAQFILSTNKVIMDEGALPEGVTIAQFAEEVARPDAILRKRKGHDMNLNVDRELAPAHLELFSRGIQMVQQTGGVTDELLGRTTNAVSGVAVKARQEQGSVATNKFFDNLRFAEQLRGEIQLSLIEQYVGEQKAFRITNMRGAAEYVNLNDGLPDNDITKRKADFIISEEEWRASMRQASVDQLFEMLAKLAPTAPQTVAMVIDLAIENMDIPNREEIVKRIRQVTGMRDPDATEISPEEEAAIQAQQQAQQKAAADAEEYRVAQLASVNAKTERDMAEARRTRRQGIEDSMTAVKKAMDAAEQSVTMPTIAKVADELLRESGWGEVHKRTMPPPQNMRPANQNNQPLPLNNQEIQP